MSLTLAQAVAAVADKDVYLLWGFILAAASVVLLLLELVVPSGGLIGLLCGVAAVGSVVTFFRFDPMVGVVALLIYMVMGPLVLWLVFRLWIHSPLARRMVLGGGEPVDEEGEAAPGAEVSQQRRRMVQLRELIGAEGVTETALRPVGFVKINGRRLDGIAELGFIEPGTPVVVTDVVENQVRVRAQA